MAREITLRESAPVFQGTDAVITGALTRSQLRGSTVRRLFQGVYALRSQPMTHERAPNVPSPGPSRGSGCGSYSTACIPCRSTGSKTAPAGWPGLIWPSRSRKSRWNTTVLGETASCGHSTATEIGSTGVAGWEIVYVTAQLLNDPARMVRTVRAAIIRRS